MAIVSKSYTFSTGATIVAAEHNSNFDTIYNEFNGGIDNDNIKSSAAIVDTKLAQITTASKVSAAAITSLSSLPVSAGKIPVNSGGTAQSFTSTNQGAIVYFSDTGTFAALSAGTSGTYLMTSGAGANPAWVTINQPSNVLFDYSLNGSDYSLDEWGVIVGDSPSGTNITKAMWAFNGALVDGWKTVISNKFMKKAGYDTVTVYARMWTQTGGTAQVNVDIGGASSSTNGTLNQATAEWKNFPIDISGLTNNTVYDIVVQLDNVQGYMTWLDSIIGFGS